MNFNNFWSYDQNHITEKTKKERYKTFVKQNNCTT